MSEYARSGRFLAQRWSDLHKTNIYLGFVDETPISLAIYAVVFEYRSKYINFRVFDKTMYNAALACFRDVVNGVDLAICEEKDYGGN